MHALIYPFTAQPRLPNQLPPGGQCFLRPLPAPGLQHNLGRGSPQPHYGPQNAKERLSQQLAEAKTAPGRIPLLRAVVESQAFKNILVDEMDMMLSRAATLIQANWRRYRLQQKLISQVTAAKAIQEAWRRFSMRRLLRSSKSMVKKVTAEEGDIPYHAPQQVRFQHQEENRLLCKHRMVSKETQCPSSDSLAPSSARPAPLPQPPESVCPAAPRAPGVAFLPHQTVAIRFPCPVSIDTKCQPGLLTETVRSACLIHIEGDTVKTKHVTARTNKAGASKPPPSGKYSQAVARPLKIQTQAHVETETFKGPLQICPEPVITKTPPQTHPVVPMTKTPPKTSPTPPQVSVTKTPAQTYPGPTVMTKTPAPVRPAASMTSTPLQPRPTATVAKIPPQVCLLASMFKPLPQTRHMAVMTKTPPQVHLATPGAKSSPQASQVATASKTSSQTCPATSITKPRAQMRLAAMLTKTPAQVATVLRTLCLAPPTAGTPKAPPQAVVTAGILNTSSPTHLNIPKAKAATNMKQAPGAVRVSPQSYLADGKVKCFPQPHPGAAAPKAVDKPPLEAETIRAGPQKLGNADTASKSSMAVGMTRAMSWTKVVEEGNKDSLQVDVPIEMAVTLPQGQPATSLPKALCHERPPCVSQGQPLGACSAKASSQLHLPTKVTKAPSLAHLVTCLNRVHSQSHLATRLTKAQSQAQLVTDTAKCLFTAHQAADLTSKTQSQPLLAGSKASTQPCQHLGVLGTPPRAKPEDRLTQLQPHSRVLSKTSQSPSPVCPDSQGTLVPVLGSAGQPTCNIESWGDSGAVRAQPLLPSQAAPCQEDLGPGDAGVAGGQSWNSAPARDPAPWEKVRNPAAVDPRLSPELTVSMQTVEVILTRAVVTIQAGVRGYLVRRTIRMWHVMATVIQAHWRGYRVRRNLARLYQAITLIQAAWRGYCTRRDNSRRQQMRLPVMWAELRHGSVAASDQPCFQERAARTASDHRCFQSCQPRACSLCQSLSSGLGSPPSVVMLVGSSPRTCHTCGHSQPTRVVQGMGRGATGQGGAPRSPGSPLGPQNPGQQLHRQNKAATSIQSAWRGFRVRRQVTEQQKAAKMVQATWRGHYTRNCLTTDALLGRTSPWAGLPHWHSFWPGV
uniref:IQ motif containing N n=1 Tax=Propithecus coquereli TaxID=379532 RepID=A0A2K6GJT2_PROCO